MKSRLSNDKFSHRGCISSVCLFYKCRNKLRKLVKFGLCAFVYRKLIATWIGEYLPEAHSPLVCLIRNFGDGRCAYSAFWRNDNTFHGLLVIGVNDNTEIGQYVFNLLSLIKTQSAINFIRNGESAKLVLKASALRVCAIENGKIVEVEIFKSHSPSYLTRHIRSLQTVRETCYIFNCLTLCVPTEHILTDLPLVVHDKTVSRFHDALRATIVLLKLYGYDIII